VDYPSLSSAFIEQAKDKTIDIIPWDVALLYAYDLDWSPRPVFQSYSAYTPLLDSINAKHFEKTNAPDIIIYSHESIDKRYPLFDEPIVFRTLLENYEVQSLENYLILQRRLEKVNSIYTPISNGTCSIGHIIEVPQLQGHHIYCNVDIQMNPCGKIFNVLYKTPSPIYIYFYIKDKSEPIVHRFIRRLGSDGLFVSKYVFDLSDVCEIFEKNYEQNIEKIQIKINHNFFYRPEMKYEFFATPHIAVNQ
jgi:hypothetical protein